MTTALIDGDIFIYEAAAACEYHARWDDMVHSLEANPSEAMAMLDSRISSVAKAVGAGTIIMCLSDPGRHWRNEVYPEYKMNRKGTRKPLLLSDLREAAMEMWLTKLKPGLEADDVMGIYATHPTLIPGDKVIVSIDKDMKTIPATVYNNGKKTRHTYSVEEADYFHMVQTLTGDSTDGYPGCPGVGPKTAEKILHSTDPDPESQWHAVLKAYDMKGYGEEFALSQARVARILRAEDYDFENNKPILWEAPSNG